MFKILFEKELKSIVLSPKFAVTFGVFSVLLLLSVFIGIRDYQASVRQYESATQLENQKLAETTSWHRVSVSVHRQPDPLQILAAGVNYDVGRFSAADASDAKLRQSFYSDDTLFALFRFVDFAFIIQVVLSLLAILFTYDAISGEREGGTLRLQFSSAVSRATYVLAKISGTWMGLIVPLLIPIGLAALMIMTLRVPMETGDWYRFAGVVGTSILYFTVFVTLGVLVSSMTRSSRVSFLVLLVVWVTAVLILPRASTLAAAQWVQVPSVAEVESTKDRFRTDRQQAYVEKVMASYSQEPPLFDGLSEAERDSLREERREARRAERDQFRQQMEEDVSKHFRLIDEDLRNRREQQERLAFALSRVAPPAAYQLAVINIAGTNVDVKSQYEAAVAAYSGTLSEYIAAKRTEEDAARDLVQRNQSSAIVIRGLGGEGPIDATDMPRFQAPKMELRSALGQSIIDLGVLTFYSLIFMGGAFLAFSRYDVR